jgi:hypothetical protein
MTIPKSLAKRLNIEPQDAKEVQNLDSVFAPASTSAEISSPFICNPAASNRNGLPLPEGIRAPVLTSKRSHNEGLRLLQLASLGDHFYVAAYMPLTKDFE